MPCCAATLSNRRWSRRHESGFLQSCSLSQGGEHSTPRRTGSSSRMGQRDVRAKSEAGERHHCTLMCASVITFPHSFNSSEKNCAVSSGLVAPGSSWSSCNLSLTFGSLRISTVSRLILAASGTGVPGRCHQREPGDGAKTGQARFLHRRYFRQRRYPLRASHGKNLQLTGTEQRHRRCSRVEKHIDVPGNNVVKRG